MLRFRLTVLVLTMLIITGCGTAPKGTGPMFMLDPAPDGMATVYHYRIERGYGSGASYTLISNSRAVTIIGNGGYYIQHLKPGEYEYKKILQKHGGPFLIGAAIDNAIAKAEHVYTITVEPNESYFLRWSPPGKIEVLPEKSALRELHGLKEFEPIE